MRARSGGEIAMHEIFEDVFAKNPKLLDQVLDYLEENYSQAEIARLVGAYVEAYRGIYGMDEASVIHYLEEAFADVYAKIQRGNADTRIAGETLDAFSAEIDTAKKNAQTERGVRDTRGSPGVKYSAGKGKRNLGLPPNTITAIQNIGQRSIDTLSSNELQLLEPLAAQYLKEMGVKSPFLRAWFGEWRINDQTPLTIATTKGATRGLHRNADTGWDISESSKVFNETESHKFVSDRTAVPYLQYLDSIIENAVLLNTQGIASGKTKSENSLLMHSLYTVADIGNGPEVIRLYVEEMNNPSSNDTSKRAYQLQNIERAFLVRGKVQGTAPSFGRSTKNAIRTVADLATAVKRYDTNYQPTMPSAIVNADGTPKTVYHGTDSDFTVFDPAKTRSRMDIQGMFFSPYEEDAGGYGANVGAYYLNIKNPASEAVAYKALNSHKGEANAGELARNDLIRMGYDGVNLSGDEYIAFYPEQVKSATDNIGTYDRNNPNIRYSMAEDEETGETDFSPSARNDRDGGAEVDAHHPSPVATPSTEREDFGGRAMLAPTAENESTAAGRISAAPSKASPTGAESGGQAARATVDNEAVQAAAREKKTALAEKASGETLKRRIARSEETLRSLKETERVLKQSGLWNAQTQQKLEERRADVQQTLDIDKKAQLKCLLQGKTKARRPAGFLLRKILFYEIHVFHPKGLAV